MTGSFEPGHRMGSYRIVRLLGRGGQGSVYLAEDGRLGRLVALKVLNTLGPLDASALDRFRREAGLAARVDHPALCTVHEAGDEDGIPYIAMAYVEGPTLAHLCATGFLTEAELPANTGFEDADADAPTKAEDSSAQVSRPRRSRTTPSSRDAIMGVVALIEEVARGLDAAHGAGILHRDVKPGNIIVTPKGQPVLLDFGLARDLEGEMPTLTRTGQVFGTPAYMAPEQLRGLRSRIDARCDVWALGATLYEGVCGRLPFDEPSHEALFQAILTRDPPDPRRLNPHLSPDLAAVLEMALEKDVDRRYRSARAMADDLRQVREGRPVAARRVTALTRASRWCGRNPGLSGSLAAAVVILVVGLVATLVQKARADRNLVEADRNLVEYERLADARRLDDLIHEADLLFWPPTSDRVLAMEAWVVQAEELAARLPLHRAALETLRGHARAGTPEELSAANRRLHPALMAELDVLEKRRNRLQADLDVIVGMTSRRAEETREELQADLEELAARRAEIQEILTRDGARVFDDFQLAFRHDGLADLVVRLERFMGGEPGGVGIVPMRELLAFAGTVRRLTLDERRPAWDEAVQRVAGNPVYGGLRLVPQEGLVPLGPDPLSGLEEFGHPQSGSVPSRNEDGRFTIDAEAGLVFVLVPGGTFLMGAQAEDASAPGFDLEALQHEGPAHEVTVPPFLLSKYEMTQGQWVRTMGNNPSVFAGRTAYGTFDLRYPVDSAPWTACHEAVRRLGCVLPEEAWWEWACRAGTATIYSTGDEARTLIGHANFADGGSAHRFSTGWRHEPDTADGWINTAPVGSLAPNGFGLHDMHGNLAEWCRELYDVYLGRRLQGLGVAERRQQVARGGAWDSLFSHLRCSGRSAYPVDYTGPIIGVRPARELR